MASTYPIRFASQLREHLRSLRKSQGLTQAQLGAQLGVSQARIAEIEANPGLVSLEQLLQLLSRLDSGLALETGTRTPDSTIRSKYPSRVEFVSVPHHGRKPEADQNTSSPVDSSSKDSPEKVAETVAPYSFSKNKGSW